MTSKDHHSSDKALEWRDHSVPVSVEFDDPYFSFNDGLAETEYVFLSGNDLPQRFCDGFQIGELGFGTGLNFFAALKAWREAKVAGHLYFTSFELYPLSLDDMAKALDHFPSLTAVTDPILRHWRNHGLGPMTGPDFTFELICGDARQTLPQWQGKADAWFLDGFSPAKNPQLWEEALLMALGQKTKPLGSFASYTAAGAVRRALSAAGFDVARIAGYGKKRHMIQGRLA